MTDRLFILILGPQAVGKMTVGMELAKHLGLKVYHNHMSIEPVLALFDYHSKEAKHLIRLFREETFKAMTTSNQKGFVFTYMMDFDLESEYTYIYSLLHAFESQGFTSYVVELEADIDTRLQRNKTELRLREKPTKRNLDFSENELLVSAKKYRLNSKEGEIKHPRVLKINNTHLSPEEVAQQVISTFHLK